MTSRMTDSAAPEPPERLARRRCTGSGHPRVGWAGRWPTLAAVALAGLAGVACARSEPGGEPEDAGVARALSPEHAAQVLARVGDRSITLGQYAAALERMDPFERMRYQTEDRRQALLDEMINVELLSREAERRGLDRRPETVELVRQFRRDEVLARLRGSLPGPSSLPAAEVSQYYQEHRAEFFEPELRRVAEVVVDDPALARELVRQAAAASPERWLELVRKYAPQAASPPGDKASPAPGAAVPGDLGYLAAQAPQPNDPVPAAVRDAAFAIASAGEVYPSPVAAGGRQHVVRLVEVREARQRSLAEVDTLIRGRLLDAREAQARRELLEQLRATTTIEVEPAALDRGALPSSAAGAGAP